MADEEELRKAQRKTAMVVFALKAMMIVSMYDLIEWLQINCYIAW